ncbi:hypothetical protein NL676_010058 [Syzygium grande]|nr:hypothetical protein NL676_010058 [Syzygium grande]
MFPNNNAMLWWRNRGNETKRVPMTLSMSFRITSSPNSLNKRPVASTVRRGKRLLEHSGWTRAMGTSEGCPKYLEGTSSSPVPEFMPSLSLTSPKLRSP